MFDLAQHEMVHVVLKCSRGFQKAYAVAMLLSFDFVYVIFIVERSRASFLIDG